jgi:hypothetical protein
VHVSYSRIRRLQAKICTLRTIYLLRSVPKENLEYWALAWSASLSSYTDALFGHKDSVQRRIEPSKYLIPSGSEAYNLGLAAEIAEISGEVALPRPLPPGDLGEPRFD